MLMQSFREHNILKPMRLPFLGRCTAESVGVRPNWGSKL